MKRAILVVFLAAAVSTGAVGFGKATDIVLDDVLFGLYEGTRVFGLEEITEEGTVIEALPGTQFKVRLDNDHEILAYPSGKMRKYYIRILLGDRVQVEVSPYDLTRGRIIYRCGRLQHQKPLAATGSIGIYENPINAFCWQAVSCSLLVQIAENRQKRPINLVASGLSDSRDNRYRGNY